MAITFGQVPHPAYLDRPIVKAEGAGQNNLGKRSVKGVVWHRMIGTLWGTDSYFRMANVDALTDYGIGVAAQDGAGNDGVIIRWNDPLGSQSGWASGPVSSPYGDGKAFVDKYGINAVNRDQASIEISGVTYDVPLSDKSRHAIAALTAYWADQYQIPWDEFPIAPQDGFSFVRWHQEFCIGTGKVCPGNVVISETSALIDRTKAILQDYQEGATVPPAPQPDIYPDGMDLGIARMLFGGVVGDDGRNYKFNPDGTISTQWLDRGKAGDGFPELVRVRRFDNRTYFVFSDGWTLWRTGNGAVKELQ